MILILKINKLYLILAIVVILFPILFHFHHTQLILPTQTNDMKFRVVIDPGHGSIDTGTSYKNIYEKDINLSIGLKLSKKLKDVNIISILTRTEDKLYQDSRRKDIKHRPEIARQNKADLFISIHSNNFPSSQPSGSQLFYKPGSDLSKKLAEFIQEELIKLRDKNNRAIKSGDFYVLNQSPCPAVLIEVGFLSNPEDRNYLTNMDYQEKLADVIKNGIINYFQSRFENTSEDTGKLEETRNYDENILYFLSGSNNGIMLIENQLSLPTNYTYKSNESITVTEKIILVKTALEQLYNPPEGLVSPLPAGTKIKSLDVSGNKLIINFSSELKDNFYGGAAVELYTLEAIKKSLFSIPGINQLEILIEGEKGQTIGGHIILENDYLKCWF